MVENDVLKDAERKRRKERLKRLLLADNNVFARRHAEQDEIPDDEDVEEDTGDQPEENDTENDATSKFKALMKGYTGPEPSQTKTGAKRKTAQPKPREEIGPSGQAYTALELQVSVSYLYVHGLIRQAGSGF